MPEQLERRLKNQSQLIVLEGPDGVGKSTLSELLASQLQTRGIDCNVLSFPGREQKTLGNIVYEIHHTPERHQVDAITPTAMQVMHVAAHCDAIESVIKPLLKKGRTVILDRYWWSTYAYGLVGGVKKSVLKRLISAEKAVWDPIKPCVIFAILAKRPHKYVGTSHEWDVLCNAYKTIEEQERDSNVVRLENDGPIEEILERMLALIPPRVTKAVPARISVFAHLKPTPIFDEYWRFASERQEIFFRRAENAPPPWTANQILTDYKFTNAFRASDRVSQYLIRNVIYKGSQEPDELLFRILLFKLFNKIETWELLRETFEDLTYSTFTFADYDRVLSKAMGSGITIYSAAYIMPSGKTSFGNNLKHRNHLRLIELIMNDEAWRVIGDAESMKDGFHILRSYPTIGDFLAYQLITDMNYSSLTDFSEMEFVMAGPGAVDGISKCFQDRNGLSNEEIIWLVAEHQNGEFLSRGIDFRSLWGRQLQLIDCQNIFCEISKYSRVSHPEYAGVAGRTKIKQSFRSKGAVPTPWYPPKWGLNDQIELSLADD
jgi:hypothetical protein